MILKIYDDIIPDQAKEMHYWMCGTEGVSFRDIDDFIAQIPADDNKIDILLHCCGGSVQEGWAMVDKLRSTGKVISATVDGLCASMAVSVLLAASERKAQPHATLHIHKPFYPEYSLPDAYNEDDLKKLATDLEMETSRMLDWYVERTGADRAVLEAIMAEDRDMSAQEAMELGFVQSLVEPMSASTKRKAWKTNKSTNDMAKTNEKAGILNALASLLGLKVNVEEETAVNFVLKTQDGSELTIDKPEGEEIAVGDSASPDGEFVLEDGRTVVVADGVITEIRPAADDKVDEGEGEGDDVEAIKAENEALKAENDDLKAKVAELEAKVAELEGEQPSADDKAILEKVNKCGGAEWLDKVSQSTYNPQQRKANSVQAPKASKTAERLAALKEKK